MRALPAGLILLAWKRQLPRGDWWWKAPIIGTLTIGAFFPLIFLSAYGLPGGLASTIQAILPLVVIVFAWLLLRETPGWLRVGAAVVGFGGVSLLVLGGGGEITTSGLIGAFGSVTIAALGFVLTKRWSSPDDPHNPDLVTLVAWQLVVGGLLLLPVALLVEGAPPALDLPAVAGMTYIGVVGTMVAYVCWFHGLRSMPAGAVALIGLVNPLVGTLLGVLVAGELFGLVQAIGVGLVLLAVVAGQPAVTALIRRRAGLVEARSLQPR